jgi:hypothetical protein
MKHALRLLLLFSVSAFAMSHEETVVRTTYARLTFTSQVRFLVEDSEPSQMKGKAALQAQLDDGPAHFVVDNVSTGNLSDIANVQWDTLVNEPVGEIMSIDGGGQNYTETDRHGVTKRSFHTPYVRVNWKITDNQPGRWKGLTVATYLSDVFQEKSLKYERYATYRVQVTLQGRSRMYTAICLFGKNAKNPVLFEDFIVRPGSPNDYTKGSLYPAVLLETYRREIPEIADWIAANTVAEKTAVRDVYCDSKGCGLPKEWVDKSLAVPFDPATRGWLPKLDSPQARLH